MFLLFYLLLCQFIFIEKISSYSMKKGIVDVLFFSSHSVFVFVCIIIS